jgi:hypothetical protein
MSAPTTDTKEQVVQGGRVGPHVMASFFDHLVKNQVITAWQPRQPCGKTRMWRRSAP